MPANFGNKKAIIELQPLLFTTIVLIFTVLLHCTNHNHRMKCLPLNNINIHNLCHGFRFTFLKFHESFPFKIEWISIQNQIEYSSQSSPANERGVVSYGYVLLCYKANWWYWINHLISVLKILTRIHSTIICFMYVYDGN